MHRHFEEIEEELKERVLTMGRLVEEMIRSAVQGLVERRPEPLEEVTRAEGQVNSLHIEVDDRCLKLIALHQPAAGDLRFIIAALKINSDLERIGDQAVNVSQTAARLLQSPPLARELLDLPRMAETAQGMLKDSLDAFVKKDAELARSVLEQDDAEDELKRASFQELLGIMQSDAAAIERALSLVLIARNLERIADHTTNIAEDVIFMVHGKDIRHHAEDKKTVE
jgi:phosphate transport system protein